MPNIGSVLKAEITRLSRKEVRSQTAALRNASAQYRRHIAEMRRQIVELERRLASLQRARPAATPAAASNQRQRFSAKGLRSHRTRLGLSAEDFGRLAGVSAQSIYNWEHGTATPREAQKAKLFELRGLGARAARARIEQLDARSK